MKLFRSLEAYVNHCEEEKLKEILKSPEVVAISEEDIPIQEKAQKLDNLVEKEMRPKTWQP